MIFGADYYPEHWTGERIETDSKMMKDAHINVVRLGEFAWSKMEPSPGIYDFKWLDEAMEVLASYNINVILCTPTATPPKWLMDKHPEIYPVDVYGRQKGFGTRRHYCSSNETYRRYCEEIAEKMAIHYQNQTNVIAWQIDNEFDSSCFCDACHKGFLKWLEKKYENIDLLNEAWGTVFWSQTYRSFEEVIIPKYSSSDGFVQGGEGKAFNSPPFNHNPGLLLDYYRYKSDTVTNFQDKQIKVLRQYIKSPITHNLMGHLSDVDYYDLGKQLDFISWDCYPNNMWGKSSYQNISMAHDLMRGIKNQNFWMMEQQSGPCGWQAMGDTPEPGQIRLWTYQALAHGAEGMVYFRWRPALFGIEQYWHGILDHDGKGRRRYDEIKGIGEELSRIGNIFEGSTRRNEIVVIKSYDNFWSHRAQPHNAEFDYNKLLVQYYQAIDCNGVAMDVTSVEVPFTPYKLVVMPAFNLMTNQIKEKCEEYVREGGNLLITYRSGTRNWNNSLTEETNPGYFRELAGIELEEYDSINFGRTVKVKSDFFDGRANVWCDVIKPISADVLATYDSHYYKGKPAITRNTYGKGFVYYVGCDLDDLALNKIVSNILKASEVNPIVSAKPEGVEIVRFFNKDCEYIILLNHKNEQVKVCLQNQIKEQILMDSKIEHKDFEDSTVNLLPYEVAIVRI